MGFCPLCGKQLPPNGICSCGNNVNMNAAPNMVQQPAPNGYQQPVQPQMPQQQIQAQPQTPQAQPQMQPQPQMQAQSQMPPQQQIPPQQAQYQQGAQQPVYMFMPNNPQGQMNTPVYMVKVPSGPNPFVEAFKAFGDCFVHPGTACLGVFDGKIPVGSGFVMLGIFFIITWLSTLLYFIGTGGRNFAPALGWGALMATIFCIVKFIPAAIICAFREKKEIDYVKILSATLINTALLDCILFIMSLFQFATGYFVTFFLTLYFGIVFYQNISIERALSENQSPDKRFWCNVVLVTLYGLVYLLIEILLTKVIFK